MSLVPVTVAVGAAPAHVRADTAAQQGQNHWKTDTNRNFAWIVACGHDDILNEVHAALYRGKEAGS